MRYLDILFDLVFIGSSVYGFCSLTPEEHPYGFIAAAFCLVHGMLMLVRSYQSGDSEEECARSFFVSTSIVDVIPLPLANIEFYMQSSQSNLALMHALTVILLIYDTMGNLGDDYDDATETVKDLALLANIASATYLGTQEENYYQVGIAASAGIARFGSALISKLVPEFGPHVDKMSKAAIIGLMTYSLTQA